LSTSASSLSLSLSRSLGSFASACSATAEKSTGSSRLWSGDQTYHQHRTESLYRLVAAKRLRLFVELRWLTAVYSSLPFLCALPCALVSVCWCATGTPVQHPTAEEGRAGRSAVSSSISHRQLLPLVAILSPAQEHQGAPPSLRPLYSRWSQHTCTHARTHTTQQRAIIQAARNGSDVRIITAGDSDIPFIRYGFGRATR
jgi:hypothetical protein